MKNPVIYIVLNGELKMSPGKAAAQAVHASMTLSIETLAKFSSQYKRTVIVLEAKNAEQIKNLEEYLSSSDIDADYYIDEGVNEVNAYSVTALAAGPITSDDEETRAIFESFPLYSGNVTISLGDRWGLVHERVVVPGNTVLDSKYAFNRLKDAIK